MCDTSTICVLPNRQACTANNQCFSGLCANTSSTPSCGSEECLSAAGGACVMDADCEPGTWCSANTCTLDNRPGGTCAADRSDECVTFMCDSMTLTCHEAPIGFGCFTFHDCAPGLDCDFPCDTADGWCCVPSGAGSCTLANELTFCCSGSCNGGTHICN